ncbi:MAG: helix-turn-helix transcriptional regulator [Candidatus Thiodiazotropha sp.]
MIHVRLKEAIERYKTSSGRKLTYQMLADRTGIAPDTLQSLATRPAYNTTLNTIEKLCLALNCEPGDLLSLDTQETSFDDSI